MRLKKDSQTGRYYVHYDTPSGPKKQTTGCTTLEEAKAVVKEAGIANIERAAKAGKLTMAVVSQCIAGRKITLDEAVDEYEKYVSVVRSGKTVFNQIVEVKAWLRKSKSGKKPVSSITLHDISNYVNDKNDKTKAQTRHYKLSCIRCFFDFCVSQHYCLTSPATAVKIAMHSMSHEQKERRVKEVFTGEEIQTLLDNTEGFWNFAVAFGRDAGLRLGDIAQMEWACFSNPGELVVWTDKRDKRVNLPITKRMQQAVDSVVPINQKYLWPEEREIVTDPKKRALLSVYFGRILKNAGIEGKSFHCLRHTYATDCAKRGIPMPHISQSLGHSNLKTTEVYVH